MKKSLSWVLRAVVWIGLVTPLLPSPASAQSNEIIDRMLDQGKVTYGTSVYMILAAADIIPASATVTDAMSALYAKGWVNPPPPSDNPITFGEFSYLLMQSFHLHGGIMYSLFPGPRYAGREVVFRRWAPVDLSPYEDLTGTQALYILRTFLDSRGGKS